MFSRGGPSKKLQGPDLVVPLKAGKRCRFCLGKATLLVNMNKQCAVGIPLDKIKLCMPGFKLEIKSGQPQHICFNCLAFVENMNNFLEMVKQSEEVVVQNSTGGVPPKKQTACDAYSVAETGIVKKHEHGKNTVYQSQQVQPAQRKVVEVSTSFSQGSAGLGPAGRSSSFRKGFQSIPWGNQLPAESPETPKPIEPDTAEWSSIDPYESPVKAAKQPRAMSRSPSMALKRSPPKIYTMSSPPLQYEWKDMGRKRTVRRVAYTSPMSTTSTFDNVLNESYCHFCRKRLPYHVNLFEHTFQMHKND